MLYERKQVPQMDWSVEDIMTYLDTHFPKNRELSFQLSSQFCSTKHDGWPSCCGLEIICNFYVVPKPEGMHTNHYLAKVVLQIKATQNRPYIAAATNATDNLEANEILKAIGFNRVFEFVNPNSNNTCYIWVAKAR